MNNLNDVNNETTKKVNVREIIENDVEVQRVIEMIRAKIADSVSVKEREELLYQIKRLEYSAVYNYWQDLAVEMGKLEPQLKRLHEMAYGVSE